MGIKAGGSRIRIIRRSLTVKWVLITCAIVLPVNILTAVIASLMSHSYRENLEASLNGQLSIYGERVDAELSSMRNLMQNFLDTSNLSKLTWGSRDDSVVEVTRFKSRLTGSSTWCSYSGICAVWDKEKDIISFFHQGNSYPKGVTDLLEQELRKEGMREKASEQWEWVSLGKKAFLMQYYEFPLYEFGILLDVEDILGEYIQAMAAGAFEGDICLADGDGNVLCRYGKGGYEVNSVTDSNDWDVLSGESAEENDLAASGEATERNGWTALSKESMEEKGRTVLSKGTTDGGYLLMQAVEEGQLMKNFPAYLTVIYILALCSFLSLPCFYFLAVHMVIKPLKRMVEAMQELEGGNLDYHLEMAAGSTELDFCYLSFNHMVDELNRLVIASYEREIAKLQSDSINMRLQVNQHMLLNFLNTIYSLSQVGKNEQIGEFAQLLMKYFRYVLRQDMGLVPVKEEVEFVQDYLKIQKVRFPQSFTSVYSLEEGAEEVQIPQLLLQNFVENTVKYGLVMGSEIEIIISVRILKGRLLLSVCDTGAGMEPEVLEKLRDGEVIEDRIGKHIGIWNCRRRLKYYYGDDFSMQITSSPGEGTQVWLELPLKPGDREETARKLHRQERNLQTIGRV